MSGLLIRHAPHLDGTESIGVWFDVAWSVYLEAGVFMSKFGGVDVLDDLWEDLDSQISEDGKPTPEEWGTSEKAQRGQDALMSMLGGMGGMGMAPGIGEEV
jgi:hypothetical protein